MVSSPKSLFARDDRLFVSISGKHDPDPSEWTAYMKEVVELGRAHPGKSIMVLVVTDGGAPSTVQRAEFFTALGDIKVRAAVLSASTLVRGMVTVFNWFNLQSKVFAPKDVLASFDFVEIAQPSRASIWLTVEALAKQLGGLQTVDSARQFVRKSTVKDVVAR
jgi:hypothetical protein